MCARCVSSVWLFIFARLCICHKNRIGLIYIIFLYFVHQWTSERLRDRDRTRHRGSVEKMMKWQSFVWAFILWGVERVERVFFAITRKKDDRLSLVHLWWKRFTAKHFVHLMAENKPNNCKYGNKVSHTTLHHFDTISGLFYFNKFRFASIRSDIFNLWRWLMDIFLLVWLT